MAKKRSDTLTDSYLEGERRQEPVPEREIDEARRAGHGIAEREASSERPTRGVEERPLTGDESKEEQLRARGRFESDTERTQIEEDFGERGLRMEGGPFDDTRNNPSILDPDADEEQ